MDINNTTIIKFLNGECNSDELRSLQEWLDADAAHADALFRLESIHRRVGAASISGREVSQRLRAVHRRIDEIRSGAVEGIPGEVTAAKIRRIVGR